MTFAHYGKDTVAHVVNVVTTYLVDTGNGATDQNLPETQLYVARSAASGGGAFLMPLGPGGAGFCLDIALFVADGAYADLEKFAREAWSNYMYFEGKEKVPVALRKRVADAAKEKEEGRGEGSGEMYRALLDCYDAFNEYAATKSPPWKRWAPPNLLGDALQFQPGNKPMPRSLRDVKTEGGVVGEWQPFKWYVPNYGVALALAERIVRFGRAKPLAEYVGRDKPQIPMPAALLFAAPNTYLEWSALTMSLDAYLHHQLPPFTSGLALSLGAAHDPRDADNWRCRVLLPAGVDVTRATTHLRDQTKVALVKEGMDKKSVDKVFYARVASAAYAPLPAPLAYDEGLFLCETLATPVHTFHSMARTLELQSEEKTRRAEKKEETRKTNLAKKEKLASNTANTPRLRAVDMGTAHIVLKTGKQVTLATLWGKTKQ